MKVVKHEIERFTKTGVVFKNGKEETFDVIVLATGFRSSIDQFLSAPLVSSSTNELGFPLVSYFSHIFSI